jgi:hypothetical protein
MTAVAILLVSPLNRRPDDLGNLLVMLPGSWWRWNSTWRALSAAPRFRETAKTRAWGTEERLL